MNHDIYCEINNISGSLQQKLHTATLKSFTYCSEKPKLFSLLKKNREDSDSSRIRNTVYLDNEFDPK